MGTDGIIIQRTSSENGAEQNSGVYGAQSPDSSMNQIEKQLADQTLVLESAVGVLNRIRNEQNISLSRLAHDAKLSKSTVSDTLNGIVSPYVHTLLSICAALQVSLADVLLEAEYEQNWGQGAYRGRNQALSLDEMKMLDVYRAASVDDQHWLRQCVGLLKRTQGSP